jgi:DNA-binding transcriptional regulator GbsR (MarR family)
MSELAELRAAFVQLWGRLGPSWGIAPTAARVYGWLIAAPGPADAAAIADALQLSRGGVSMALKELRDWGIVVVEREIGSRRDVFRPETDLEIAIKKITATRKRREWDPMLHDLRDWIPRLAAEKGAEAQRFRARLQEIEGIVSLVDDLATRFLAGSTITRIGLSALVGAAKLTRRRKKT